MSVATLLCLPLKVSLAKKNSPVELILILADENLKRGGTEISDAL